MKAGLRLFLSALAQRSSSIMTPRTITPTTTTVTMSTRTFYRRPLPQSCTALSSKEGRNLFQSAMQSQGLKAFFPLMEQHSTQAEPSYCGVSTLAICLNAFAVDPRQIWKGPWRWYEESMLNCCMDMEDIKRNGITMKTFHCLAVCQGLKVQSFYAQDSSVEHFRSMVKLACVGSDKDEEGDTLKHILVASYNRQGLGQTGTGHFSPIGAYDSDSDSVLILDTARFKYGVHWVPLELLFQAMQSVDADTNQSRGYMLLTNDEDDDRHVTHLPISMLLRLRMRQNAARQSYKEYLQGRSSVTWEDAVRYWTKDMTDTRYIWEATNARYKPTADEGELSERIAALRLLIAQLTPPQPKLPADKSHCSNPDCHPNHLRSLNLEPSEAIFLFYMASISDAERAAILDQQSGASEETLRQLQAEVDLIRYAIDNSDEMST